jgi:Vitamin B6 photo-protection and homoeostasis
VTCTNRHGGHARLYSFPPSSKTRAPPAVVHWSARRVASVLRGTFLPAGYPQRTRPGYVQFAAWSAAQDLSTQLRSVLGLQRILQGVGVGSDAATAWSAVLQFLVRDGTGMVASLVFTAVSSWQFRYNVKRWRLLADIMVDVGITAELVAGAVPARYFLPLLCFGNVCKAICGVAAGACGGALNLHWAQPPAGITADQADLADTNAKFGAQRTVTGSLGLLASAAFLQSISRQPPRQVYLLYTALTLFHIYANVQCMRLVAFDSLNTVRLDMILAAANTMPTPLQIAQKEPLFFLPHVPWNQPETHDIKLGVSLDQVMSTMTANDGMSDLHAWIADTSSSRCPYFIRATTNRKPRHGQKATYLILLRPEATPVDCLMAYYRAYLYSCGRLDMGDEAHFVEQWQQFAAACQAAGWDLAATELSNAGYEISMPATATT